MLFFSAISAHDQNLNLAEYNQNQIATVVREFESSVVDLVLKFQFVIQLGIFDPMMAFDYSPLLTYLNFLPDEYFDHVMDMASLAMGRSGTPQDFIDFSQAVIALPDEKRFTIKIWWFWTPRYMGPLSGSLTQMTRFIEVLSYQLLPLLIPASLLDGRPHSLEDAIQAFERRRRARIVPTPINQEALFHVHRIANVHMENLWKMITSAIVEENIDVTWTKRTRQTSLHKWIAQFPTDLWDSEERSKIIKRLHQLPYSKGWESALKTQWKNLGDDVSGLQILETVMAYCAHHPEFIERFLVQGLYDILSAFDNDDEISCPNGIAERWILWMRDLTILDIALVEEIVRSIYQDARYQEFEALDETSSETILNWCQQYSVLPIVAPWQVNLSIKQALKSLKSVFEEEWSSEKPAKKDFIHRIFQDKKISSLFTIFDDEDDLFRQNQIKKILGRVIPSLLR